MGDKRFALVGDAGDASRHHFFAQLKHAGYRLSPGEGRDVRTSVVLVMAAAEVQATIERVRSARDRYPNAAILVVSDRVKPALAAAVAEAGGLAVLPPRAIIHVVKTLFMPSPPGGADVSSSLVVEEAHDSKSGRLDAKRLCKLFHISLHTAARSAGVTASALSRRPTAQAAQAGLRELEFVWASLTRILGSDSAARAWLHTGHPSLAGRPPLFLLERGSAKQLGDFVRRGLAGEAG